MLESQIRQYIRATVEESDKLDVSIINIANSLNEKELINPILVKPLNISGQGIKFKTPLALPQFIKLGLRIRIEDKLMDVKGTVIRIHRGAEYEYAVNLTDISDYQQLLISSFIKRKMVEQIHQLRNDGMM